MPTRANQAVIAIAHWTGRRADAALMRAALEQALPRPVTAAP